MARTSFTRIRRLIAALELVYSPFRYIDDKPQQKMWQYALNGIQQSHQDTKADSTTWARVFPFPTTGLANIDASAHASIGSFPLVPEEQGQKELV